MTRLVPALERRHLVPRALELLREDPPVAADLDAVDELDVGRASPCRHQAIGRRTAVLVREDHRIAELSPPRRRHDLVPRDKRQVGEAPDRVRPRVENRRHRLCGEIVASPGENRDVGDVDRRRSCPDGAQRRIAIDRQPVAARRHGAERDAIIGDRLAAREQKVLRVPAVHEHSERRRFTPRLAPGTSGATRAHGRDGFARRGGHESPAVVIPCRRSHRDQRRHKRGDRCGHHRVTAARSRPSARGLRRASARRSARQAACS